MVMDGSPNCDQRVSAAAMDLAHHSTLPSTNHLFMTGLGFGLTPGADIQSMAASMCQSVMPTPSQLLISASQFIQDNQPMSPSMFLNRTLELPATLPHSVTAATSSKACEALFKNENQGAATRLLNGQSNGQHHHNHSNGGEQQRHQMNGGMSKFNTSSSMESNGMVGSPLDMVFKQEPGSSSNSPQGVGTSSPRLDRRSVPACAICGTDSTGIHFGVDACAACSAFFRRTVVLGKDYACTKGNSCNVIKDGASGQKCRSCRFAKCIRVGMDKTSVQHRRDAIGKYSTGVKREHSPDNRCSSMEVYREPAGPVAKCISPPTSKHIVPSEIGILDSLVERFQWLTRMRKLFYADGKWNDIFANDELPLRDITNFSEHMYHLWKVEPRLAAEFVHRNKFMNTLDQDEKVKIFKNFVVLRQAVEEPYITWKNGGLENDWWIMMNKVYMDLNAADRYWSEGVMDGLPLDKITAVNLFVPSFRKAMENVGSLMKKIDLQEIEMIALLGIVMLDPNIIGLLPDTRLYLHEVRSLLIKDLFNYYEGDDSNEEPEVRLGNLFMILSAIKVHSICTHENMRMLDFFRLIPRDPMYAEIIEQFSQEESKAMRRIFYPAQMAVEDAEEEAERQKAIEQANNELNQALELDEETLTRSRTPSTSSSDDNGSQQRQPLEEIVDNDANITSSPSEEERT